MDNVINTLLDLDCSTCSNLVLKARTLLDLDWQVDVIDLFPGTLIELQIPLQKRVFRILCFWMSVLRPCEVGWTKMVWD